jgi:hypothetical protein
VIEVAVQEEGGLQPDVGTQAQVGGAHQRVVLEESVVKSVLLDGPDQFPPKNILGKHCLQLYRKGLRGFLWGFLRGIKFLLPYGMG